MRIAVFTDCFLPSINGVVTSVANASRSLAKKGHKILILTSENHKKQRLNLGRNIYIEHFKPINVIKYPDFDLAMPNHTILRNILKFNPSVIHSHMPSLLGWEAVLCSKVFRIPLIGTYHTLLPDFLNHLSLPERFNKSRIAKELTWNYTRRYYNRCDMVTTPSAAMRAELKKNRIRKPIRVISNGIDLDKFSPKKVKKDGKNILYVGRISYEKNIEVIIRAFKNALKDHPGSKLTLVGKGPDEENLKKEARPYLNKNIFFKGPVDHEKLNKIYSKADIFATASTIETEGLVILEAMASGLPIIGVDSLAVPYIVKHKRNGFIAQPGDEKRISGYMSSLLSDSNLRKNMGKESAEIVKKYSLHDAIDDLEELYFSLSRKSF